MDVLRLARKISGLSNQEIAQRLGQRSVGTYFSTRSNDFPSFPQLPDFCLALGNDLPLAWLLAQVERKAREAGNGGRGVAADDGDKPWHDKALDRLLAASRQTGEASLVMRDRLATPDAASCDDLEAAEDAILAAVQELVAAREILKARRKAIWTGPDIKFRMAMPPNKEATSEERPFVREAEGEATGAGGSFLSFCRRLLFWRR